MNHHSQVKARKQVLALAFAALATTALSAHASTTQTDPVTGQVWQIFDNVSDGVAQGYRRATVDDFKQLLVDSNWLLREGTTSVYDLTTGGETYANDAHDVNVSNIHFGRGLNAKPKDYWNAAVIAAWLQDGESGNSLGLIEHGSSGYSECSYSRYSGSCVTHIYNKNTAEIASTSDLVTKFLPGSYPSTLTGSAFGTPLSTQPFDPLYGYRQLDSTIQAGTFMITSVPEPASAALLSLGLMSVVASARARRSQQAHRQG